MTEESWNHFTATGSVSDYLKYRQQTTGQTEAQNTRSERRDGHEYHDNRNGTFVNAN